MVRYKHIEFIGIGNKWSKPSGSLIFDVFWLVHFCLSVYSVMKLHLHIVSVWNLKVYYASTSQKTIERIDFDGGSREVLISNVLDSPEGLAIDWIQRKMYWTDKRFVVF